MKKFSTLLIAVVALVTVLTYGFNFPFNENASGFKTIMSQSPLTPLNIESPKALLTESFDGLVLPTGWKDTTTNGTYLWQFVSTGNTGYPSVVVNPHSIFRL